MTDEFKKHKDDNRGNLIGGLIVTGIGVLFLLVNFDIIPSLADTWPVFVIIVGLALIISSLVKKKKDQEES